MKNFIKITVIVIAIFTVNSSFGKVLPMINTSKATVDSSVQRIDYHWADTDAKKGPVKIKLIIYTNPAVSNKVVVITKEKTGKSTVCEIPVAKDCNRFEIEKTSTGYALGYEDKFEKNVIVPILLASTTELAQN
jgi:hypothetical protein